MLEIKNTDIFHQIIKTSLHKSRNYPRWVSAINKAVVQMELHGEFMDYDHENNWLLIWSQSSDKIYTANGACQCTAYTEFQVPCWHRALAKLVRNFFGYAENKNPRFPKMQNDAIDNALYLKESSTKKVEKIGSIRI